MDWSASGVPLVATRTVHFAATAITAGNIIFRAVVAMPVLRAQPAVAAAFRDRTLLVSWFGLVTAAISGAIWLLLQAASMSDLPLKEAMAGDVLWTVATDTQFGEVTILRAGLATGLAALLAYDRPIVAQRLGLLLAIAFAASLAWIGHASATSGIEGFLHLAADALHLVGTAAWIGGLFPLIVLLITGHDNGSSSLIPDVIRRFSTMGMVSVATLTLTGVINTIILIGSLRALIATEYGQLLLIKLAAFALMLAFAAVNRLLLTPRLGKCGHDARASLVRNSTIELVLGLVIFAVVGLLGTLHPAIHLVN